jgi:hypothetical protein
MIALIVIIIAVLALWALFGLWGARSYRNELDPELRAISDAVIENRKDYIIEDGRRLHSDWQKRHPLLGRLYSYKPAKYFRNNQLNTKRYPY